MKGDPLLDREADDRRFATLETRRSCSRPRLEIAPVYLRQMPICPPERASDRAERLDDATEIAP